jgi:hypothetical protein
MLLIENVEKIKEIRDVVIFLLPKEKPIVKEIYFGAILRKEGLSMDLATKYAKTNSVSIYNREKNCKLQIEALVTKVNELMEIRGKNYFELK